MSDTPTDTPHTLLKPLCIKRKLRVAFSKAIHLPIHLKGILQNYVNTICKYNALKIGKIPQELDRYMWVKNKRKRGKISKKFFAYQYIYIIYQLLYRYITSYISCPIFTFFSHKEKIKQNFLDFLLLCCHLGHIN